jgi:hypothetical protein
MRDHSTRAQLRTLLVGQRSMSDVDRYLAQGVISAGAHRRFERLWAVSTATEHPYTAAWSLRRWSVRRDRVRRAIRAAGLTPRAD